MSERDAFVFSVYEKTLPEDVERLLLSLSEPFADPATDVWVVCDGPVGEKLQDIISSFTDVGLLSHLTGRNLGLGGALQTWFEDHQCYRFVFRIDADDIYVPGRLEAQRYALASDLSLGAHSGSVRYIRRSGSMVRYPYSCDRISLKTILKSPMNHPAAAIRVSALRDVGGFPVFRTAQDIVLWHRLLHSGWKLEGSKDIMTQSFMDDDFLRRRGVCAVLGDLPAYKTVVHECFGNKLLPVACVLARVFLGLVVSLVHRAIGFKSKLVK
jgi:glycosyltransferase involved in cell wall biosynthesis